MKKPLSKEAKLHLAHQHYQLKENLTIRADTLMQEWAALRACYTDHSLADLEYGVEGAMALLRAAGADLCALSETLLAMIPVDESERYAQDDVRNLSVPRPISSALYRGGLRTLSALFAATDKRISACPDIGPHRLKVINDAIRSYKDAC
ncbi:hypothetical protein [Microbulbifer elongatus]|uniref:hypothetical protein n=1 Tax=Microbulbifer elongatus TaxID=86173 RepID=UPI001CFD4453|nr:hypothetical protein [Microbulbifer elongatus]